MKYVIDMIDDIREAIENNSTFFMGVIALEKELNADGNSTMSWAKPLSDIKVIEERKEVHFLIGDKPLLSEKFLKLSQELSNEAMMYELFVQTESEQKEIIGFSENMKQKTYMLLFEG